MGKSGDISILIYVCSTIKTHSAFQNEGAPVLGSLTLKLRQQNQETSAGAARGAWERALSVASFSPALHHEAQEGSAPWHGPAAGANGPESPPADNQPSSQHVLAPTAAVAEERQPQHGPAGGASEQAGASRALGLRSAELRGREASFDQAAALRATSLLQPEQHSATGRAPRYRLINAQNVAGKHSF